MTSFSRLVNQKGRLFIVELDFGLVLLQLDLIHVLDLVQVGLVDEVHDASSLESTFEPKSVRIYRLFVHSMLALRGVEGDARERTDTRTLGFLEVNFDPSDEPLGSVLQLASGDPDLLPSMIYLSSLHKLIAIRLLQ